jgi:hypothetical protein
MVGSRARLLLCCEDNEDTLRTRTDIGGALRAGKLSGRGDSAKLSALSQLLCNGSLASFLWRETCQDQGGFAD